MGVDTLARMVKLLRTDRRLASTYGKNTSGIMILTLFHQGDGEESTIGIKFVNLLTSLNSLEQKV